MTPTDLLLTEQTRPEVEAAVIAEARRRARRRRSTYGVVVVIATVVVAAVFAVLDRTPPSRGTAPAGGSRGVVTAVEQSKGVAWCVPDPDGRGDPIDGEELVVGEGAPVRTWCSFGAMAGAPANCGSPCPQWNPTRANHLYQIGGSTILVRLGGPYRVADGRLARLEGAGLDSIGISHDGRYVATTSGQCSVVQLHVHEVATATEVATTTVPNPDGICARVAGVDIAGRVYVFRHVESQDPSEVLMYDPLANQWARVSGIPASNGRFPRITYITDTGFAVTGTERWVARERYWLPSSSVEGRVDSSGRFATQRRVPVGMGVWSPDRSYVAEGRAEGGVTVRPAAHLTEPVVLALPGTKGGPGANIQWESPTSVVVASFNFKETQGYRCDVRSGACEGVDRDGWMALGENAWTGG